MSQTLDDSYSKISQSNSLSWSIVTGGSLYLVIFPGLLGLLPTQGAARYEPGSALFETILQVVVIAGAGVSLAAILYKALTVGHARKPILMLWLPTIVGLCATLVGGYFITAPTIQVAYLTYGPYIVGLTLGQALLGTGVILRRS